MCRLSSTHSMATPSHARMERKFTVVLVPTRVVLKEFTCFLNCTSTEK